MCAGGVGEFDAAEHAGDFVDAFGIIEHVDAGLCGACVAGFLDAPVLCAEGGDLGEVCDAQDLAVAAELAQQFADDFCDGAADAAVDFVKNQGGYGVGVAGDDGDGECDAGQLAT